MDTATVFMPNENHNPMWDCYEHTVRRGPIMQALRTVSRWKGSEGWLSTRGILPTLPAVSRPYLERVLGSRRNERT